MRDLDQSKAITVHEGIQQSNLLQLATPEMLTLSQPPADFRLEEDARSTRIVPALHEIEGLRRERKTLKDQVNNTQIAAATFGSVHLQANLLTRTVVAFLACSTIQDFTLRGHCLHSRSLC